MARFSEKRHWMCVFWFTAHYCLGEKNRPKKNQRNINHAQGSSSKVPLNLSDFNDTWIFSTCFLNNQISNFMKIVQWELSCSMRRDRQTDRHNETNSRFSQVCERAYKHIFQLIWKIFRTINNSASNEKGQERNEPARILTQSTQDSKELGK